MPRSLATVALMGDVDYRPLARFFSRCGLTLCESVLHQPIPGTFWGEPEAGLVGCSLYFRADTPVHSVLHEGSHFICMSEERRIALHTNAGGDDDEEHAVCYLQILIAQSTGVPGFERLVADMDAWGYSFRLGSTLAWFQNDATDARTWLEKRNLIPV